MKYCLFLVIRSAESFAFIAGYSIFFHLPVSWSTFKNVVKFVTKRIENTLNCLLISFVLTDITNTLKCRNKCVRINSYNSQSVLLFIRLIFRVV